MRRLRFEVAYDGTDFHGWQVQPRLPTIQGALEEIIGSIEGRPVHVAGSGRTDAGVHALAQVAAVSIENPIPADNFRRAVNRLLPHTIRIKHVTETVPDFHPRFDARRKTYEYRIFREEVCPPFDRRFVLSPSLSAQRVRHVPGGDAGRRRTRFRAFAASDDRDEAGASKVRTIFSSRFRREDARLIYRVTGSGFLKHMVRNLVGVLIEVGKGNWSAEDVRARLQPACGISSGPAVPASGLFLISVE